MAEGLDQAAQAFQTEINPNAPRPRDDGGRFTPKPEHMFEPRPVEGDSLTGDTRDAGDDSRLAQRERRIADGWVDEREGNEGRRPQSRRPAASGDEPLPFGEEGARSPAGDDGHERQADEQGVGPDEKPDQHAPDGDGKPEGDGEGEPEQDAASRFKITTLDGEPVEKFEVTVDGAPLEVSLDEALSGYIREQTFHKRMNKVDTARQAVESQAAEVAQWRDTYAQRLQALDRELAELTPQEPDWDREFAANPAGARERQKAYQAIYGKRQQIANEMARTAQEARAEYDRKSERYAVDQFSQFVADSKIPDEPTLRTRMSRMRSYGQRMGFSEAELSTVYDKRMLRVLDHAAQYDAQARTALPKAVIPGKGKTLTPGVATPVGNATRRHIDEAQNKLAKTGRLDDAAAVFSRLIR
jgi:hypothetical protein